MKKRVGEVSYELELPNHMYSKRLVFHIIKLKRCRLDAHYRERTTPSRGSTMIINRPHLILDKILDLRTMGVGNTT